MIADATKTGAKGNDEATELHRHQCEVREWMRRRGVNGIKWIRKVLSDIEKRRGAMAAQRIRDDFAKQWKAGNRGEFGDWR